MSPLVSCDVLSPRQLAFLADRLPEPPRARTGRPAYSNRDLLPGILRVLRSGCRWRDLDHSGSPSGVTHWRRLRYWHKWKGYRQVWRALLNLLVQSKRLDRSLVSLDGTLIPSQEFAEQTGYSGKHRAVGTKLSLLVDRTGTPLAVSVAPGNYHDGALGFLTLANIFKPLPILRDILPDAAKTAEPTLLADKGYDSLRFRRFVQERGFRPLLPTRSCIPPEQAVGELYAEDVTLQRKRYVVERTLGWVKGFRRLRYRVDRTAASFHAFVCLAVLVLCAPPHRAVRGSHPCSMTALDDGSVVPPQTIARGRGWDAMIPMCGCRSAVSEATKGKAMSSETMAITPDRIMQLGTAFWGSKTLLSAVELGVFTRLADGPLDGEILRQQLGLHPRSARDFFDALVALGLLERHDGQYANTSETALFLDRGKPSYVGGMLEMANSRLYRYWGNLTEGLRTGEPQNELKEGGLDLFSSMALDEGKLRGFMQAMTGLSLGAAGAIATTFPWDRYRTFADVGTAQGGLPVVLATAHPHLRGIGVDLPNVQPIFEEYVRAHGLQDRVAWQAVDIWREPFPPADVVILGHMLHGWGLERKKILLQKAYAAVPDGGAVIAYDAIIDDGRRENAFGLLFSLNMLIENQEGAEYTFADCQGWMREAGFRKTYAAPLVGPESMVVGVK